MNQIDFTILTNALLACDDMDSVTYARHADVHGNAMLRICVASVSGFSCEYTIMQDEFTKVRYPGKFAAGLADLIINEIRR